MADKSEARLIREWAKEKGLAVGERGRINADIIAQYRQEQPPAYPLPGPPKLTKPRIYRLRPVPKGCVNPWRIVMVGRGYGAGTWEECLQMALDFVKEASK